jgi:anaerobic magnesium-protoporphyrin IX monomethyl ester cyclase
LPFPAWSEVDREKYRMPISGDKFLLAVPHRGCPFNCIFCASKPYYGSKTRFRSPARFVDELQWVGKEFGIRDFLFWAETYTINKEFVMNVNKELINRHLKIKWVCNSRVDTIDEEMMMSMKDAGCWMVGYGIESGSQKILDAAGKRITLEQIEKTVKLTKKHMLTTTGHVIIGLPGESKETVMQTISFINSLPLDFAQFYTAAPWPGTELYKYAKDKGILKNTDFRAFTQQKGVLETESFSAEDMSYYCKLAYKKFYGRLKILAHIATRMMTPKNLCHTLSTFVSFLLKGSGKS